MLNKLINLMIWVTHWFVYYWPGSYCVPSFGLLFNISPWFVNGLYPFF